MKHEKTINELIEIIGGADNIKNYEHCATRLRVMLKDDSKLDKKRAGSLEEAKGYFFNTGQHQFIFGTGLVDEVYEEFKATLEGSNVSISSNSMKEDVYANLNPAQKFVRILADILVPLIPALVTTGLLMGIRGLLIELGLEMTPEWTALFGVLTDTAFAFLPVLIAYSATMKFGGNPIIGIVVGLMMVAPQFPNAYGVANGEAEPLKLGIFSIVGYQGSIFPAIIAGWLVSKLQKWFKTWVPKVMDLIVTPFLTISFTLVVILLILGPVVQSAEKLVIGSIVTVIEAPLGIGYILFGALQQVIVITGLHHSLGIIEISLLNDTGYNVIQPLTTASMAGQFGAAISTALLLKDQVKRSNMISSAVPTLFGITEPLLFGINLRSMRVFASGMVGGAVGGFLTYLLGLKATGMGITFIPGLLLYSTDFAGLAKYIVIILISFVVGFLCIRVQGKKILSEI